jgi:methylmalonyl-CoA/ethylmalonyl-CoA epimerase
MPHPTTDGLAQLLGASFEHVAVAAPRLRDLVPIYVDLLGGRPLWASDNLAYGFRVVVIGYADGTWHELMEPLRESTFFDKFFSKRPTGGLHHITFLVDDIAGAHQICEERGFTVVGRSDESDDWKEFFLDLRQTHGTLIQIGQSSLQLNHTWTIEQILRGEHGNGEPSP